MTPTRKTLVVYLVSEPETPELAQAAVEAGADVIELGFPFSDPLADGPVIQRASERALGRGMRTARCLECLAATRERLGATPIVPMTYAALLEAYGWDRFASDAAEAGATTLIVSDVPAGQRPALRRIHLVAPTSTDERIAIAAASTDGWLYLVTVTGTTGARAQLSHSLETPRRAVALAGQRRPALRGLWHLDPRAGGRSGVARGRRHRRLPRRAGRRGGPAGPRHIRRIASRSARRLRPETFAGQRGTVQWFTRTRLPQRAHRARRCVSRNRFASGTRWPSTRQRYRLTPPGRPARASFRCSPRPASR